MFCGVSFGAPYRPSEGITGMPTDFGWQSVVSRAFHPGAGSKPCPRLRLLGRLLLPSCEGLICDLDWRVVAEAGGAELLVVLSLDRI